MWCCAMGNGRSTMVDLMRVAYSLVIVMLHSVYLTGEGTRYLFPNGHLAVEWFCLVSGFLMAKSADSILARSGDAPVNIGRETRVYVLKKYGGLFPYLLFAWCLSFAAISTNRELTMRTMLKNAISSIWQVLVLDMSGLDGYQMLGATWYLSAMFLVMPLFLAMLLRRNHTFFAEMGSFLLAVFLYGIMQKRTGSIYEASVWTGLIYMGVVRVAAGLSLGCFCYRACLILAPLKLTGFSRNLLTAVEFSGYALTLALMARPFPAGMDLSFTMVLLFAVTTTISFSGQSCTGRLSGVPGERFLGPFSRAVYLCHGRMQGFVVRTFPMLTTFSERVIPYMFFSMLFSVCCVVFVRGGMVWVQRHKEGIRRIFFL